MIRGRFLPEAMLGAFAVAFILGVFGPSLDGPARSYASYGYTADQVGEHRRLELDAQRTCADLQGRGENAGYVVKGDGAVVCTDKHGRRGRNPITIAVKTEVRP